MSSFKYIFKILLLVALSIGVMTSCSKDDEVIPEGNAVAGEGTENSGLEEDLGEITLYKVNGTNIQKVKDFDVKGENLAYQKDIAKHNEIWDLVKKIVPPNQLEKLDQFMIYDGTPSGSAGFVLEIKEDLSSWQMGIAINFAYEGGFNVAGELAYVIIHEFGHILTLNDTQLDASQTNCSTFNPGEGCSKPDAYINELYQNYWADIWGDHQLAWIEGEESLAKFYTTYQDRFVTEYAATNPGEDIAEVFATYVTKKDIPTGDTIAEKKILLMHNRSELVDFRNHIRRNLNLRGKGNTNSFILPEPGKWKQRNKIGKSCLRHKH